MKIARFCICIVLLSTLLISFLPADVYAADHSCGPNATWRFQYGRLTISGTGPISDAPWKDLRISITSVVIEEGITQICANAFLYFQNLKSVSLPSTLTYICASAFEGCYALEEINLPDNLKRIETWGFKDCYALTSITIPASLERLDNGAFQGCSGLKELHITDLDAWCNIIFDYAHSNPLYYAGELYLKGELVTDLVVPEGCDSVHAFAFAGCKSIRSVTFPDSLTWIGAQAFRDCTGLRSIVLPEGVTEIGSEAFRDCTNLQHIALPSTIEVIDAGAFQNCIKLTKGYYGGTKEQLSKIFVFENNDPLLTLSWQLPMKHMLPTLLGAVFISDLLSSAPMLIGVIIIFVLKRKRRII